MGQSRTRRPQQDVAADVQHTPPTLDPAVATLEVPTPAAMPATPTHESSLTPLLDGLSGGSVAPAAPAAEVGPAPAVETPAWTEEVPEHEAVEAPAAAAEAAATERDAATETQAADNQAEVVAQGVVVDQQVQNQQQIAGQGQEAIQDRSLEDQGQGEAGAGQETAGSGVTGAAGGPPPGLPGDATSDPGDAAVAIGTPGASNQDLSTETGTVSTDTPTTSAPAAVAAPAVEAPAPVGQSGAVEAQSGPPTPSRGQNTSPAVQAPETNVSERVEAVTEVPSQGPLPSAPSDGAVSVTPPETEVSFEANTGVTGELADFETPAPGGPGIVEGVGATPQTQLPEAQGPERPAAVEEAAPETAPEAAPETGTEASTGPAGAEVTPEVAVPGGITTPPATTAPSTAPAGPTTAPETAGEASSEDTAGTGPALGGTELVPEEALPEVPSAGPGTVPSTGTGTAPGAGTTAPSTEPSVEVPGLAGSLEDLVADVETGAIDPETAIAEAGAAGSTAAGAVTETAAEDLSTLEAEAEGAMGGVQEQAAGAQAELEAGTDAAADAAIASESESADLTRSAGQSAQASAHTQAQAAVEQQAVTLDSLRESVQTELDGQLETLDTERESALGEVDAAIDAELLSLNTNAETELGALDTHFQTEHDALVQHRSDEQARFDTQLTDELQRLADSLTTETTAVTTSAENQKTAVRQAADSEIASIRSEAEAAASAVQAEASAQAAAADPEQGQSPGAIEAAGARRAAEIRSQAEANVAAVEARRDQSITTIETDTTNTVAALQAEHDSGAAAAQAQHDQWISALDSDLHLMEMSLAMEKEAAAEQIRTALADGVARLEEERTSQKEALVVELDAKREEIAARQEEMLAQLEEATEADLERLEAEVDTLLEEVQTQVDETLTDLETKTQTALQEIRTVGQEQLDALAAAGEAARQRITDAVQAQKDNYTRSIDYAMGRVTDTVDRAIGRIETISGLAQSIAADEAIHAVLDVTTLGQTTVAALNAETQTRILDAELAADRHGVDYDRIDVDATTGAVKLVRNDLNGTTNEWTLSDTDQGGGPASLTFENARTYGPGEYTDTRKTGVSYSNGTYGVNTSYEVSTGEGDTRESSEIKAAATFGNGNVGGEIAIGWESGEGPTSTGGEANLGGQVGADGVSINGGAYTTEGGYREDGGGFAVSAGPDGVQLGGDLYRNGFGVGASGGIGPDGWNAGANAAYKGISGGASFRGTEDGWGVSGNLGISPKGGAWGASIGGSYNVTTDEDFVQYAADGAAGRYGFAREVVGDDLVSYGLRDTEDWSVNAGVNVRAVSLGFAYGEQTGSSAQFMQSADNVDLTDDLAPLLAIRNDPEWARNYWIRTHPEDFADRVADASADMVEGVNGPQDLAFGVDGANGPEINDDVLARGTAWSFDNFAGQSGEGSLGLYGIGLTLGGDNMDYEELTIARSGEGDDRIVVNFTTMDEEGVNARFGATDLLEVGGSQTTTHTRSVEFELDPNDPADVAALQRMTSTGILPGAENALPPDQASEFEDLYAQFSSETDVQRAAEMKDRLAELSEEANTAFMNSEDFQLGEVGDAEYQRRRQELSVAHDYDLSGLGFELASGGWSETWTNTDYRENGDQQQELGFDYAGQEGHFLMWKTRDAESSFIALNPEAAGDLAMVGGSEWRITREQAQRMADLGIAGADDWRMQGFANDELDNFTGIGRASMAMDDAMLDRTMELFGDQDLSAMWNEVGEEMSANNEHWLEYLMGQDTSGMGMTSEYELLTAQMGGTDFVDHSDPEAMLELSPIEVLQENAKREAWRANEEQILEYANNYLEDSEFDSVDDLMDTLAKGELSDYDRMMWESMGGGMTGIEDMVNGMAFENYRDTMTGSITEITEVRSPENFGELSPAERDVWLHLYTQSSDNNPWYALDMIQGAVEAEEANGGDASETRDALIRRLFREAEHGTGDHDTATMQYIDFIGELEERGGEWATMADTLKTGVYVAVYDEGVLEKSRDASEVLDQGADGRVLDLGSGYVSDLDREIQHLFDNDGREHLDDADDLMDRVEGLRMAAGGDGAAVMQQWIEHAATSADYDNADDFVRELCFNMTENKEYADKLLESLEGTPYEALVRQELNRP